MNYITIKEAAENWNMEERRVRILCQAGRIDGAVREDGQWLVPEHTEKPSNSRYKERKSDNFIRNF